MMDLEEKASPAKRVALFAFVLTWAALWFAWVCVAIARSYIHYGNVVYGTQMWVLPLTMLPLVLAAPAILTLGLERFGPLRGAFLITLVGACTSALQAFLVLGASGDDPLFAGYSRPLLVITNLVPGAAWGLVYSWLASQRQK